MSPLASRFDELKILLDGAQRVVVSGHEQADGDAVGAVGALRRHLELERKDVTALLVEPLNPRYGFMDFARHAVVFDPVRHAALLQQADVFVMCDLSALSRLGPLREPLGASGARTVCFDHHPCPDAGPADLNLLDSHATSTGRIVWDYLRHVDASIDRQIAESVFVSLATDTGWFRYPNTDASVLELAAELAGHKLDLPGVHHAIYQSLSAPLLRLLGHAARSVQIECDGALAWTLLRQELIADLGLERFDVDPIIDVLRATGTVRVVALFTELADGRINVSLRSSGTPDVNLVARGFGGGGHAYSAGTTLPAATAGDDVRAIVAVLRARLRPA